VSYHNIDWTSQPWGKVGAVGFAATTLLRACEASFSSTVDAGLGKSQHV
jgi:hypothetical protein